MKGDDIRDGEDRWLQKVGRVAREEIEAEDLRRFDRRWDAYAAGELTPEEQAALLEETRASDEGQMAAGLFRPLPEDFKKELARRALAEIEAGTSPPERSSRALRWRERLREWLFGKGGTPWRFGLVTATALLVAVIGLRLLTGSGGLLPAFDLEVNRAVATERSTTAPLTQGEPLHIRLRPETETRLRPELRIYARMGGRVERWPSAEAESGRPNENGVIFLETPAWAFGPGEWTLCIALGRRGTLPGDAELRELLRAGLPPPAEAQWQLLEKDLVIVEPPPDP